MKQEDFENFDKKKKCVHGNPKVILPDGVFVREGGVIDKNTDGLVEINGKPLWINGCRTMTSAKHGFVPLNLNMAIERIGEKEGKKYHEKWWCSGKFYRRK